MIILYLQTLQDPNDLYFEQFNNELRINEDKLNKRIESVKGNNYEQDWDFIILIKRKNEG